MIRRIYFLRPRLSFTGDHIDSDSTPVVSHSIPTNSRFLHKFIDRTWLRHFPVDRHSMDHHQLYLELFEISRPGSDCFHYVQRTVHSITDTSIWYLPTDVNCVDDCAATANDFGSHLRTNNTIGYYGESRSIRNIDDYSWTRSRFDSQSRCSFDWPRWKHPKCECMFVPRSNEQDALWWPPSLHRIGTTCITVECTVSTISRTSTDRFCRSMIPEWTHWIHPVYPAIQVHFFPGDTAVRAVHWSLQSPSYRDPSLLIEPINWSSSWLTVVTHRCKPLVICSFEWTIRVLRWSSCRKFCL